MITKQEDSCLRFSDRALARLGVKAPNTFESLGTVLSLLDRMAACYWRCPGGDHLGERIAGRCCSSARASLRLLRSGYYDESLNLTRTVAEAANLLFLFMQRPALLDEWKNADDATLRNRWSPAKVRKILQALGGPIPAGSERYTEYCVLATHLPPYTWPQAHNPMVKPTTGAYYQQMGYLVCLNELAWVTAMATFATAHIIKMHRDKRKIVSKHCIELIRNLGGVDVLNIPANYYGNPATTRASGVIGPHSAARVVTSSQRGRSGR